MGVEPSGWGLDGSEAPIGVQYDSINQSINQIREYFPLSVLFIPF